MFRLRNGGTVVSFSFTGLITWSSQIFWFRKADRLKTYLGKEWVTWRGSSEWWSCPHCPAQGVRSSALCLGRTSASWGGIHKQLIALSVLHTQDIDPQYTAFEWFLRWNSSIVSSPSRQISVLGLGRSSTSWGGIHKQLISSSVPYTQDIDLQYTAFGSILFTEVEF